MPSTVCCDCWLIYNTSEDQKLRLPDSNFFGGGNFFQRLPEPTRTTAQKGNFLRNRFLQGWLRTATLRYAFRFTSGIVVLIQKRDHLLGRLRLPRWGGAGPEVKGKGPWSFWTFERGYFIDFIFVWLQKRKMIEERNWMTRPAAQSRSRGPKWRVKN